MIQQQYPQLVTWYDQQQQLGLLSKAEVAKMLRAQLQVCHADRSGDFPEPLRGTMSMFTYGLTELLGYMEGKAGLDSV